MKRKIRKSLVCVIISILLLQNIVAYARTDGYTEEIFTTGGSSNSTFYYSDGTIHNHVNVPQQMWAGPNEYSNTITVYIPYIGSSYLQNGVTAENPFLKYTSNGDLNIETIDLDTAKEFAKLNGLETLAGYLESCRDEDPGLEDDVKTAILTELTERYNPLFKLKAFKSGYSLLNYVGRGNDYWFSSQFGNIIFRCYSLEPIFAPTTAWYGKVTDLTEGQELAPGSLIYAEAKDGNADSQITSRLFVDASNGTTKADLIEENGISFTINGVTDYSYLGACFVINKVPAEYNNRTVLSWTVNKIYTMSEFVNSFSYFCYQGGTEKDTLRSSSGYTNTPQKMIELIPHYEDESPDTITVLNPTVSIEGLSLKLTANAPTKNGVEIKDSIGQVVNSYYIERNKDYATLAINTQEIESKLTPYDASKNRILYPGSYRIWHQAAYDEGGTTYKSPVGYDDIVIAKPLLPSPSIICTDTTVTYGRPGPGTIELDGTGDNTVDSYNTFLNNLQLIHLCTQDKNYDDSRLPTSITPVIFDGASDTLEGKYNKVYAYTVLTIPESDILDPTVFSPPTYYSEAATQIFEQAPTVTFDSNGGICTESSRPVQQGQTYGTPDNPVLPIANRKGYEFLGWFTLADGGTQITDGADFVKTNDSDETLYAHWREYEYTLKFDANGGEGNMEDATTTLTYSQKYTLPANQFTRKNMQFVGWNTNSEATSALYKDKETVSELSDIDKDEITLYAIWKKKSDNKTPPSPKDPDRPSNPDNNTNNDTVVRNNANGSPVKINRIIENIRTGDAQPYLKWILLLFLGVILTLVSVIDIIRHKRKPNGQLP